jgi:putative spermidine/putrescine transport system substrate-binding protein
MTRICTPILSRRTLLGAGLAGTAALAAPAILQAQDRSIRIGVYGGFFKDSFDQHVFPAFTEATGIAVESVAEPTGEAWLVQLEQAARAGQAPADSHRVTREKRPAPPGRRTAPRVEAKRECQGHTFRFPPR